MPFLSGNRVRAFRLLFWLVNKIFCCAA